MVLMFSEDPLNIDTPIVMVEMLLGEFWEYSSPMRNADKYYCLSIFGFFFLASVLHLISAADYVPIDKILLNCGASPQTTDADNRKWTSDIGSKFASSVGKSSTSTASTQDPSVPEVPYMTARIFQSEYTYSFPVASGHKFVRLYFYPASYLGLNPTNAIFSVFAGPYTLLKNFSAAQTTQALNYAFIVKEYSVNVPDENLDITFKPSSSTPNSYAFVNGIEIVSMPDIYSTADGTTMIVGQTTAFYIDNSTALENFYRLNVGGNDISPSGDTGLYRAWYDDSPYIFGAAYGVAQTTSPNMTIQYPSGMPTYVAPVDVYATARSMGPYIYNQNYNLTWIFTVDSGFAYLVRLHFCEVDPNITKINQRVFDVFLNNQTAQEAADVIAWTERNGVPVCKDYVVLVPSGAPQQDLWLALHPNIPAKPQFYDAILNGVEIFKVNDTSGNLAGPNPVPAPKQEKIDPSFPNRRSASSQSKNQNAIIGGSIGGGIAVMLLVGFFVCAVSHRRRPGGNSSSPSDGPSGWLPLSLYGHSHSAGSAKTNTTGSYASSLPSNLFRHFSFTEIKAATNNFDEALLLGVGGFGKVYKGEIDSGTIKVAIKRGNPLSGQGVHEFQTEIEMLSKLRHRHLVSLIGYCEENCEMILIYDYMSHGTLREHLYKTNKPPLPWKQRLEICIGAARALNPALPKEQVNLAEWASHCQKKGILDQIIDPYLKGKIAPECFKKIAETAMKCVEDQGIDRPSMGDVLWNLEFALQLQESAEESGKGFGGTDIEEDSFDEGCIGKKDPEASPGFDGNTTDSRSSGMSVSIGGRSLASGDSDELTPSSVFSEIMNPKGR
ncbi:malectin/receptor-like protein kinase family protein [Actinidia rufa]|uniref:Malectin/receptor-like protein kinase family protein n=1 Tax=Actinidia rufa TaxID=165716 RepID=A0A7J0FAK8_9ERIC|nr:malectin/receptor-like protein kinase family protein [Actinidia rufa]